VDPWRQKIGRNVRLISAGVQHVFDLLVDSRIQRVFFHGFDIISAIVMTADTPAG
jgi:hypothetical protein